MHFRSYAKSAAAVSTILLAFAAPALISTVPARAQAVATGTRRAALSAYGLYTRVHPDYGSSSNNGVAGGMDFTLLNHFVSPSLEVRATYNTGSAVTEKTFGGGLRLEKRFGRFNPFADVMASYGVIDFAHPTIYPRGPYAMDNAKVYTFGGGLEYDLSPAFALRGEFQSEHWTLNPNNTLTPTSLNVGIVYHIPFRSYKSQ